MIVLNRFVQFGVTFYTCSWPDHVTDTKTILLGLIDAGLPGSLEMTIEIPLTRVTLQDTPAGVVLQIAIPGDDRGAWRRPILEVIDGGGS